MQVTTLSHSRGHDLTQQRRYSPTLPLWYKYPAMVIPSPCVSLISYLLFWALAGLMFNICCLPAFGCSMPPYSLVHWSFLWITVIIRQCVEPTLSDYAPTSWQIPTILGRRMDNTLVLNNCLSLWNIILPWSASSSLDATSELFPFPHYVIIF